MSAVPKRSAEQLGAIPLPPQERGRARRARILEAATRLIDSADRPRRHAVTLREIADAADVPAASIYHYFPDVDSLVAEVVTRYGEELVSATEEAMAARVGDSPANLLNLLTSAYHRFFAARPGLRELWFDRRATSKVVRLHRHYRGRLAEMLHARMQEFTAEPPNALTYTMLFEMSGAGWEMAFQLDAEGDSRVIAELTEMATSFVHRRLGLPATRPRRHARLPRPPGPEVGRTVSDEWEPAVLPPQARGRRRRAAILAAAAELLDSAGPHSPNLTIRGIAAAAGTSPASIYRYFDDLESLVAAVATQYMTELLALSNPADADGSSFDALTKRSLAAYQRFFALRPGLRELWFDRRVSERVQLVHEHYRWRLAERNRERMARFVSDPGELWEHAVSVAASTALWDLAFTLDPTGHPEVVDEIAGLARDLLDRLDASSAPHEAAPEDH